MAKISERTILIFLLFILYFLRQTFSPGLGDAYLFMALIGLAIYYSEIIFDKIDIPFEKTESNRANSVLIALFGYWIYLVVASLLSGASKLLDIQSILKILQSEVPIFKGSFSLQFFSYGVIIPTIETIVFFALLYEILIQAFSVFFGKKLDVQEISGQTLFVMAVVASIFTVFHFQVRIEETFPLLLTFIFGYVSVLMVAYEGEMRGAVLLHIINNSAVLLFKAGLLTVPFS